MLKRFFARTFSSQPPLHEGNNKDQAKSNSQKPLSYAAIQQILNEINESKPNFKTRLTVSEYQGEYPEKFHDAIDWDLINTPIMINNTPRHTLDKRALKTLQADNDLVKNPFTNLPIESLKLNTDLRKEEETFVAHIERIKKLEKKLLKSTTPPDASANLSLAQAVTKIANHTKCVH